MRFLLRREQVHKLACNHYLTASLSFAPAGTNKKAVTWQSVDYAERPGEDDPNRVVSISVRFKVCLLAVYLYVHYCILVVYEVLIQ